MPARRASIMGCASVLSGYESVRQERLAECREKVQERFALSQLPNLQSTTPAFQTHEIEIGQVLGRGQYGTVSEIQAFQVPGVSPENIYNSSRKLQVNIDFDEEVISRVDGNLSPQEFLAKHCVRADGHGRYAIKTLSSHIITDTDAFIQGVQNMAIESRILAGLDHPSIIKLRGVASVEPFNEYFFFVVDRLFTSFEQQIAEWESKMTGERMLPVFGSKSKASVAKEVYKEKIVSMFHLADALTHMHSRKVIYRNLKVQNVGLDIRGNVRLFDFGYAREVFESSKLEDGTYRLTQLDLNGPLLPRFLAPEVANGSTYNERVDSYSFALLLWQTMSGESPFDDHNLQSLKENVWKGNCERPLVNDKWPLCVKILMKRSWEQNLQRRNPMKVIADILRKEALSVLDGDNSQLTHAQRRSTFVLRDTGSGEFSLPKNESLTQSETSEEDTRIVIRRSLKSSERNISFSQHKKRFQHRRYSLSAARNLADDDQPDNLNESCDFSVISYPPVSYSAAAPEIPATINMDENRDKKARGSEKKRSSSRKSHSSSSSRNMNGSDDDGLTSSRHGSRRSRSSSRKSKRSSSQKRISDLDQGESDPEIDSSQRKNGLSRRGRSSSRRDTKRSSSKRSLKSSKTEKESSDKDEDDRSSSRKARMPRSSSKRSQKRSSSRKSLKDDGSDRSQSGHSARSDLGLESADEGGKLKRSSSKKSFKRSSSRKSLKGKNDCDRLDRSSHSAQAGLGLEASVDSDSGKLKRSSSRKSLRRNKERESKTSEEDSKSSSSDETRKLKRSGSRKSLARSKSISDDSESGSMGSNKSMNSDRSIKSSGTNKTASSTKSGNSRPGLGKKSISNKSLNDMLEGGNWSSGPTVETGSMWMDRQGSRRHLSKSKPSDMAASKINSDDFGDWTESAVVDDPFKIEEIPSELYS